MNESLNKKTVVVFFGVAIAALIIYLISGELSDRDLRRFGAFLVGIIDYIIWRDSKNKNKKNN